MVPGAAMTPEPAEANPVLAASPTPSPASQGGAVERPAPSSGGARLRAQPGAVAPHVRDPHAEFRKGGWIKPLLFVVFSAAVVGGLFFGIPAEEPPKPSPFADAGSTPMAVIGASVSPEVIPDPDRPSLQNQNPERNTPRQEEPPAAPSEVPDRSGSFGDAFKASAK